ncbi:hypothetical protein BGZ63DRAFT_434137 [Mariannaea sp. PMI_226]|nr:hypothetical protein BGZ63DRAFT_434137 [Mariannaea sp. PMI_226]
MPSPQAELACSLFTQLIFQRQESPVDTSFEKLAPELLSMILQCVDSPLDLHHLISASPSCFRAYLNSPKLILSSIIKNAFESENIQHAVAILRVPTTNGQTSSFLDKYFNSPTSFDFP